MNVQNVNYFESECCMELENDIICQQEFIHLFSQISVTDVNFGELIATEYNVCRSTIMHYLFMLFNLILIDFFTGKLKK